MSRYGDWIDRVSEGYWEYEPSGEKYLCDEHGWIDARIDPPLDANDESETMLILCAMKNPTGARI